VRDEGGRRRAVVTGASSGIGRAFAERLAADDYDLVVVARRADSLHALADRLRARHGVEVAVLPADLCDAAALARVEDAVRSDLRLELLVNNAGFGSEGPFHELDVAGEARMLRLNCEALLRLTHAALGPMVKRGGGAVINVSSGAGFVPSPFHATYAATKAFVTSFTEAIGEELAGSGVRVQALCPGFTRTEFQSAAGVDVSRLPEFVWQPPEAVVEASLDGLRRGALVVVPGLANRVSLAPFRGLLTRTVGRRLLGLLGRPR
jgi:hypothetical protein